MRNRAIPFVGMLIAAASLAGCLIIPADYYTSYSRENVAEEPPATIVPGTTTREEVLMNLGEPDRSSQDETELWYMASKIKAIVLIGDRGAEIQRDYIHVIRFGRNGSVETLLLYETPDNQGEIRSNEFGTRGSMVSYTPEPHFSRAVIILPAQGK